MKRAKETYKRGNVSLEAAILLPLCLLVIALFTQIVSAFVAEMNLRQSLEASTREASLALATAGLWQDLPSTAVDYISDEIEIELPSVINEWFLELSASHIAEPYLLSRVDAYYEEQISFPNLSSELIQNQSLQVWTSADEKLLWFDLDYEIHLMGMTLSRQMRESVVLWHPLPSLETEDDGIPHDIWSYDNFMRGTFFQTYFGRNLPTTYPVFASFNHGRATAMMSTDLTAPSYQSDATLYKLVEDELNRIAAYTGPNFMWQNHPSAFHRSEIKIQELLMIIPVNSEQDRLDILEDLRYLANELGVNMKVIKAGTSFRYQD